LLLAFLEIGSGVGLIEVLGMLLSWVFRACAIASAVKSALSAVGDDFVASLFWLAVSFFLLGASFDAANIFRVAVLGRVDCFGGKRALNVRAKYIFGAAAVVLLLAWLLRHLKGPTS
jgi:hypothetical protein